MTICDMCQKNYGKERFSETGYFTAGDAVFHICKACSERLINVIENEVYKHVGVN